MAPALWREGGRFLVELTSTGWSSLHSLVNRHMRFRWERVRRVCAGSHAWQYLSRESSCHTMLVFSEHIYNT